MTISHSTYPFIPGGGSGRCIDAKQRRKKKREKERSLPVLKKSILVGKCVEDAERFRSHPRIFFHKLCTNGRDIAGCIECKEQVSTRSRDIK